MPYATVNGNAIHYRQAGHGRPLVLLHGFPLDSRMWRRQLDAFGDSYQVIAADLPGFGQSRSDRPFTMDSVAADLRSFLRQISALPCILGGLSMGGYVALAYQKLYPADVQALILVDTRAEADTPEGRAGREAMMKAVEAGGSAAAADGMLPKLLAPAHQNSPLAGEVREMAEGCPQRTILNALTAMRDRPDRTADLPLITQPALVIVGDQDILTPPATARRMQQAIAGARLEIIPNAGHIAPMENPNAVNAAIESFLGAVR